ncbi:CapA family protein [uncultured Desulfuromusa sp.]|uniref:CapA family protein n=1 Tax=uncultured Desulfuromusa sp. TaxID=219183 RepID=UPI002AA84085|nr:CapA family protein [uncultured Desulfuromusa sp.]
MKICFSGDVFLGGDLLNKRCENIVQCNVFNNASIRVVNLEQPISDSSYVEDKCTLYTGSFALQQLKDLGIDAVNLSHNHIQDKGLASIGETIEHLESAGIKHFGAGADIGEAEKPCWLTDDIAVLGYCEFGKPYLREIAVAEKDKPGTNPLRLEKVKADLDNLPTGARAILYFHWGMEHVWLPPAEDINLAKKLLEDDRVITIIGMHPHRVQGVLTHAKKQAYMCLGNFIFPNFYIAPPVQIHYPSECDKEKVKFKTRQYHEVYEITYKKWRFVNRVSLLLEFCTEREIITPVFVVQNDNSPTISDLKGIGLAFYRIWFKFLSSLYKLPLPVYGKLWRLHAFEVKITWRLQIMFFHLRQMGVRKFSIKLYDYAKRKISK